MATIFSSSSFPYFSWKKSLSMNHVLLIFFSIWYCKLVYWDAAEACYVIPCYEGRGLQELWKVNKGITFMGESSGVFAVFHAVLGYTLFSGLQSINVSRNAHFIVGLFSGCTLCGFLLSLNMVYVWSAETNTLLNLSKLQVTNDVFEESGRHMIVNSKLTYKFLVLSYISSIMCFFQLLVLIQLVLSQKKFTRYFRLLVSGSERGEDIGLISQNSNIDSEAIPFQLQRPVLYTDKDNNDEQQQIAVVASAGSSTSSSSSSPSQSSSNRHNSNNNTTTLLV